MKRDSRRRHKIRWSKCSIQSSFSKKEKKRSRGHGQGRDYAHGLGRGRGRGGTRRCIQHNNEEKVQNSQTSRSHGRGRYNQKYDKSQVRCPSEYKKSNHMSEKANLAEMKDEAKLTLLMANHKKEEKD